MGNIRQSYDAEFKQKTVKHMEETKKTLKQVSKDLDIPISSLSTWRKRYGTLKGESLSQSTQVFVDYERLKKLEQQTKDLQEENEILKKAMHFFTKNQD